MISEIYILFFKASLTIHHTATVSQKKSGTSKKNQWDFQISRVGSLDFLDLKVNGSPVCQGVQIWNFEEKHKAKNKNKKKQKKQEKSFGCVFSLGPI